MEANLDLKDPRVPTFISFDQQKQDKPVTKPATKRKRTARNDNAAKPQKKRALKTTKKAKQAVQEESNQDAIEEPLVRHVWIGAATNEEKGAFAIYHGEKDQRNYTHVFEKKDHLEDLEYAYVLGALKAVELAKPENNTPIVVNTTCRDLPRAIAGKANTFLYDSLARNIRDIINDKDQLLSVRHTSGRHVANNHKAALALAIEALEASEETTEDVENLTVGEMTRVVEKESDQVEQEETVKEKEDTVVVSSTSNDDQLNHIVEDAIDAAAQVNAEKIQQAVESAVIPTADTTTNDDKDVLVETQVETIVETTVEVKVIESQVEPPAEPMELVQEEKEQEPQPQPPKSSWASVLGLQSIINVLSSPFKARRN